MRTAVIAGGAGILAALTIAAAAAAAGPTPTPSGAVATPAPTPVQAQLRTRDIAPTVLGLGADRVRELRQDGLSLAQIAERQNVDPEKLVNAFAERWTERIEARVENGALTSEQAAALEEQVRTRATEMVQQTAPGGMGGGAVGAGPQGAANGAGARAAGTTAGNGSLGLGPAAGPRGTGTGVCDGTGPHGAGRP